MRKWLVYYADREFARENGDPCLGTVVAETEEQAKAKCAKCDFDTRTRVALLAGMGYTLVEMKETSFLSEELG